MTFECTNYNYPTIKIPNKEPFTAYTLFELAVIAQAENIKRYGKEEPHLTCVICCTENLGTVLRVYTTDEADKDQQFEIELNGE